MNLNERKQQLRVLAESLRDELSITPPDYSAINDIVEEITGVWTIIGFILEDMSNSETEREWANFFDRGGW